jgi:hypothetical protein
MRDLTSATAIKFKGVLFVVIGLLSGALVWIDLPTWRTAVLLGVCVWAFCRAYYFAFYVIEKYVDPKFKFAGLCSAVRYLMSGRYIAGNPEKTDTNDPRHE